MKAVYVNGRDGTLNVNHPNHHKSKLALDAYIYRVKKYMGAYAAALGGVDAIVFTGEIGGNLSIIQEMACSELEFMGVDMGSPRSLGGKCYCLSKPSSRVNVLTMPTDEELIIARETILPGKRRGLFELPKAFRIMLAKKAN